MPSIFSKNCILTGDLDSYCLVCSIELPDDDRVMAHIQGPEHQASMDTIVYVEKFQNDFIRKVKGLYYCELCNLTFPTTAKVGIHVTEDTHLEDKRRQLKRVGTTIVFQNNILIEERAWNGLVEDTCVVCNAEFEDDLTHKSKPNHVLSVVRRKVIVDDDNNIYRKIIGGCHCLTCNIVVSEKAVTKHFNSMQHKNAFLKGDANENDDQNIEDAHPKVNAQDMKKADELNSETVVANDHPSVFDGKSLFTRTVLMKDKDKGKPSSAKTFTPEVEGLAKKYNLSVNKFNNTVYCKDCNLQVPAIPNCVTEHVAGKKHKNRLTKCTDTHKQNDTKIQKLKIRDYITSGKIIETVFGQNYVTFNDKFCLNLLIYVGLASKYNRKLICQLCQIDLNIQNADDHFRSELHLNVETNCIFIASLENEFVRQVKSDLFHCGFCGHVESDFDDMLDHLNSVEHILKKSESERLLQRFKQEELYRRREEINFFQLLNLLGHRR